METIRSFRLPGINVAGTTEPLRYDGVQVEVPQLSPAHLCRAIVYAQEVVATRLRRRSVGDLLERIDGAVTRWLSPEYALRRRAEAVLPMVTGFSPEMIRHGLPLILEPLRADSIRAQLDTELGDHRVLDAITGGRRAVGPQLITHILAGNIPGLAAVPMVLSLAIKAPALVKSAAGDPVFPALLADSIAAEDPDLGAALLVTYWRGGAADIEQMALTAADVVVASGSDSVMAALAVKVPGRFVAHGHKISFAAIGRECLRDPETAGRFASALAYDVSLWDQQGCLSPQLCFVERSARVGAFALQLATALSIYATRLPPRRLDLAERAQVLRFRQEAEWSAQLLASPESTDWSLSIEEQPAFRPTCLNRCLRLVEVDELSALPALLAPHRQHLEAAGLAIGAERLRAIADLLAHAGVHRICPLGEMQKPPLSWRQSGRPRVGDWVRWTEMEEEGLGRGGWSGI